MHQTTVIHHWWCSISHGAGIAVSEALCTDVSVWKDTDELDDSSPHDV